MTVSLHHTLAPIGQSAAAIEEAFLRAGASLSRGLETFGQLNTSMGALSAELTGGELESAAASLDGVSRDLLAVGGQLPEDVKILDGLVATNEGIAVRLDRLLDHIRTMTIVARSARIEAIVFDNEALGLENFTQQIKKLTSDVQEEVSACARAHATMSDLLKGVTKAQATLDRDYRHRLVDLANELTATFGVIRQRRERSAGFVEDLTARSARITQAAGLALVSLQGGDSIRQRLEHVEMAVQRIVALGRGDGGANPTVPQDARTPTMLVLCRLQHAQLIDAVAAFEAEAGSIDTALTLLIEDTQALIEASESVFGDAGTGSGSFLDGFRERLTSAAEMVATCEASRGEVASVVAKLHGMLAEFQTTVTNLNEVTVSIIIVGLNAGLKAVRLGPAGRSLVVIADELKRLANEIAKDAAALLPLFDAVRGQSRRLGRHGSADDQDPEGSSTIFENTPSSLDAAPAERGVEPGPTGPASVSVGGIDEAIGTLVGDLDAGSRRLDQCLTSLRSEGDTFDADLKRASDEFARAVAMNDALLDAATALQEAADETTAEPGQPDGRPYASAIIEHKYTMAREREIHAAINELPIAC